MVVVARVVVVVDVDGVVVVVGRVVVEVVVVVVGRVVVVVVVVDVGAVVVVDGSVVVVGDAVTVKVAASLFQCCKPVQPLPKTPTRTVCRARAAVSGTVQEVL